MAYDVAAAFEQIENELIESMMRNFKRHRAEETAQGYNWTQWQAEQLAALEEYRQSNSKRFGEQFSRINGKVEEMLCKARESGAADQEASILSAIKKGYTPRPHRNSVPVGAEFFKINDGKMNALLNATTHDLEKAEHAVLRKANDSYRKIIFNAQVFANSGSGTYEKAVDMATRDFLRAGINSIVYKNGARHTISDYADMAIKTANTRARLMGEGEKRREWGETLVIVRHKRGCAKCARHIGHVYIDDIFSGGTKSDGDYPLLSDAVKDGLLHPRCNISLTTYREGITPKRRATEEEIAEFERRERIEERQAYHEREAEKNQRIADNSLDPDNKKAYAHRAEEHRKKAEIIRHKLSDSSESSNIVSESVEKAETTETVANSENRGIIEEEKDLSKYIGQPIEKSDNQSIREWYVANVRNIPNLIDKSLSREDQARQAFEMRNKLKREARVAMSDVETADMLERERPVPTFEDLIKSKIKRKGMTREEAIEDILKTASITNADVNKEFGL